MLITLKVDRSANDLFTMLDRKGNRYKVVTGGNECGIPCQLRTGIVDYYRVSNQYINSKNEIVGFYMEEMEVVNGKLQYLEPKTEKDIAHYGYMEKKRRLVEETQRTANRFDYAVFNMKLQGVDGQVFVKDKIDATTVKRIPNIKDIIKNTKWTEGKEIEIPNITIRCKEFDNDWYELIIKFHDSASYIYERFLNK